MGSSDSQDLRRAGQAINSIWVIVADSWVDLFEAMVQKRLEGTCPKDLAFLKQEVAKFKANLMTSLEAPEEAHAGENLSDLFKDHPHALGKRPLESDDANVA